MLKKALAVAGSLKLTVALLACSILLVYLGTWAQVDQSIQRVEKGYFHSVIAWVPVSLLTRSFTGAGQHLGGSVPLPGGYLLGLLLLVNLITAHVMRVRWAWPRIGIFLIHFAVILLLVGEGVRSRGASETRMVIHEGSHADYSFHLDRRELAIIDGSQPDADQVTAIPASRLTRPGVTVTDPRLPFDVKVVEWHPHSAPAEAQDPAARSLATAGLGVGRGIRPLPPATGVGGGAVDQPSAFVQLSRAGRDLGTYLISVHAREQSVAVDGKAYGLALRFERQYKPYRLHLLAFSFDRYPGTDVPKNFSSRVRLVDPGLREDREVLIWMNHPLRHRGETFFQADWDKETERGTVLQVVRNPGWVLPYVACVLGGVGLCVHFAISLWGFLRRRARRPAAAIPPPAATPALTGSRATARRRSPPAPERPSWRAARWVPLGALALCLFWVGAHLRAPAAAGQLDLQGFGALPITFDGRVQPLDSVARNAMKVMARGETFETAGVRRPAVAWLLDRLAQDPRALEHRVLRIDHPDVISMLRLEPDRKGFRYSVRELTPEAAALKLQVEQATAVRKELRTPYHGKVLMLAEQLRVFERLGLLPELFLLPPAAPGGEWRPLADAIDPATRRVQPAAEGFLGILRAYRAGDAPGFNARVQQYGATLRERLPAVAGKVRVETTFNRVAPHVLCIGLYLLAMILAATSWLGFAVPLRRAAYVALGVALAVHTLALIARVYLSGRPPVTNLASSAVFIGWGAALLAVGVERVYRNGLAAFVAGLVAFPALLIAHFLSLDGDTLKVLQAVLDTNFWLATHVVCITLGYAATFLAGLIAIVFVVGGALTRACDAAVRKDLLRMIYGVTCFAMLFSFVGTVLGGIWADQSWGRFWGWDPKENGAVMIVLCNALFLHARWGGMVQERGIAALAIGGNIVTSWSWFGTNLLGVGLHSYGFMSGALYWLLLFVLTQAALIAVCVLPARLWRSYGPQPAEATPHPAPALPAIAPRHRQPGSRRRVSRPAAARQA